MIIGLSGFKNAGKDTVAAYLIKQYGYERRAFADPVKKHIAGTLDIPYSIVDNLKNDPDIHVIVVSTKDPYSQYVDMTFREFIQRDATEGHRDIPEMGDDFWVDLTLPVTGYYPGRDIVISDVRFRSEAARVRRLGGLVVTVSRAGLDNQDQHRSEQEQLEIEPDYTLFNNGSIEELNQMVDEMIDKINVAAI